MGNRLSGGNASGLLCQPAEISEMPSNTKHRLISTQNNFNTINTQMLAAGMYLIEVINENKTIYTRKFVKE